MPGGEWLYLKIYAAEPQHEELLTGPVAAFVRALPGSVDRWFFIRYRDAEPHLRVRLHGRPDVLNTVVLPAVHEWTEAACAAGLARSVALDTYEPEVGRYGGPAAMATAEQVFHADSQSVLAQLDLRLKGLLPMATELLAAANYVDILRSLEVADWASWVSRNYPDSRHRTVFREHRADAAVIDPVGDWDALRALPGGEELVAAWRQRAAALREYAGRLADATSVAGSLLHMHHNRLSGVDREHEDRCYAVLRGVAAAHRGRSLRQ